LRSLSRNSEARLVALALSLIPAISALAPTDASARPRAKKERGVVESLLVQPPKDREICFSPDEPCDVKLAKFVMSAEKTLDIAIYDLNLAPLAGHFLDAAKKGLKVRILVDRKQAATEKSLVPKLVESGADVRLGKQRGIMHNKFVIVDGRMIETGSFNYTNGAAFANNENQIYLADPAIVKRYRDRFEELWERSDPNSKLKSSRGRSR